MNDLISLFLVQFSALFIAIDVIGVSPVFISLSAPFEPEKRLKIANKGILITLLILLLFSFAGFLILNLFGITLSAFEIAGGILLLLLSIEMVLSAPKPTQEVKNFEQTEVAIFPLAVPLLSGPATITLLILYMQQANGNILHKIVTILALLSNIFIAWIILRCVCKGAKFISRTVAEIITKILGILLTALACQFIINGITTILKQFHGIIFLKLSGK